MEKIINKYYLDEEVLDKLNTYCRKSRKKEDYEIKGCACCEMILTHISKKLRRLKRDYDFLVHDKILDKKHDEYCHVIKEKVSGFAYYPGIIEKSNKKNFYPKLLGYPSVVAISCSNDMNLLGSDLEKKIDDNFMSVILVLPKEIQNLKRISKDLRTAENFFGLLYNKILSENSI